MALTDDHLERARRACGTTAVKKFAAHDVAAVDQLDLAVGEVELDARLFGRGGGPHRLGGGGKEPASAVEAQERAPAGRQPVPDLVAPGEGCGAYHENQYGRGRDPAAPIDCGAGGPGRPPAPPATGILD